MNSEQMKAFLAGLCVAGLLSGASLILGGCATPGKSS
ncbi:MAG: SbtA family thio(seleno)oxazole RiPP natural product precursor [Syntrophales bacterium]|jgi:radical SAM modification target selenobiotic family peptide|nr:SbtA family thio(seleno)oxazole RiPP natural product precursor [Syntrophales bacterium]MCU0554068.1 SbtA family thio(seleno)oxazole RiPP natural product precursor [Syntrophales bacterium]MCU0583575.1 SbtA family thio(seleno)oxazole RiPP natural product precursor [Syntrophales bacterium]